MKEKNILKSVKRNRVMNYDDIEYPDGIEHVGCYVEQQVQNNFKVFLDKGIEEPHKYRELIHLLLSATENDVITFIVSCNGGNLQTTLDIINALKSTQAHTQAVITSNAHSGASMIALNCTDVYALPHSAMLVHQVHGVSGGSHSEQISNYKFSESNIREIYQDIYQGFMSPTEIEEVLNGKDFWFGADEINSRIELRDLHYKEKMEKHLEELKQSQEEEKPVKPKKSSKVVDNKDMIC